MHYNFEWDPAKAAANVKKHGITFEQATRIFKDPIALTIYDKDNSSNEENRWITLGKVDEQYYLTVVHTYRDQNSQTVIIRVISARPATKHEIKQYQQG